MDKTLKIIESIIGSITVDGFKRILYKNTKSSFFAIFRETGKKYGLGDIRPDPKAIKDMENRVIILSQATTDRLKGNLRYELLEGMNAGESVDTISERLKTVFKGDDVNTERIARNEVLIASKNGRYEAYKEGGAWGTEWRCTDDDRTSPICRRMDGEVRKIGDPFVDPKTGDTFDIAHGHIQCRCSERILFEDPDAEKSE